MNEIRHACLEYKNMQFNGYIFKISNHINFFVRVCGQTLSKYKSMPCLFFKEKSCVQTQLLCLSSKNKVMSLSRELLLKFFLPRRYIIMCCCFFFTQIINCVKLDLIHVLQQMPFLNISKVTYLCVDTTLQ